LYQKQTVFVFPTENRFYLRHLKFLEDITVNTENAYYENREANVKDTLEIHNIVFYLQAVSLRQK